MGEIVKKKKKRIGQRFFNGAKKKMVKSTYKIKPVKNIQSKFGDYYGMATGPIGLAAFLGQTVWERKEKNFCSCSHHEISHKCQVRSTTMTKVSLIFDLEEKGPLWKLLPVKENPIWYHIQIPKSPRDCKQSPPKSLSIVGIRTRSHRPNPNSSPTASSYPYF